MIDSVLIIGGPTGSGKSRIALDLATRYHCEIVNADSRQIYRDLAIGTDLPSREDLAKAPHHLFGFLEPSSSFSAADYEKLAVPILKQVQTENRIPIVVGGTGFYLKALLKGVWRVSGRDDNLRDRFKRIEKLKGKQHLHRILMRLDPASAEKISPNDTYRIVRALEIYFRTGLRKSEIPREREDRFAAWKFYVDLPRETLLENIRKRAETMFERGWIKEVQYLIEAYPEFHRMPAAGSLGYHSIIAHLKGEIDLETCKQTIVMQTSQYAKRQLTWFRNQDQFQPLPRREELYKLLESVLQ